jgi:hypothetical protein
MWQQGRGHGHGSVAVVVPEHAGGRGRGLPRGGGGRLPREGAPALQVHRAAQEDGSPDGQRGGK